MFKGWGRKNSETGERGKAQGNQNHWSERGVMYVNEVDGSFCLFVRNCSPDPEREAI